MRHETAIELAQEIVGEPVRTIRRLRDLEAGATTRGGAQLGRRDAVPPAREIAAQNAKLVEIAARAEQLAAEPPGARHAAVASVSREELIPAFSRQNYLQ